MSLDRFQGVARAPFHQQPMLKDRIFSIVASQGDQILYLGTSGYATTIEAIAPRLPLYLAKRVRNHQRKIRPGWTIRIVEKTPKVTRPKCLYSTPKTGANSPEST